MVLLGFIVQYNSKMHDNEIDLKLMRCFAPIVYCIQTFAEREIKLKELLFQSRNIFYSESTVE